MENFQDYTITISPPKDDNQLWGAWCEEIKLSAFGETESEAFYNLIENIPVFFKIKGEKERTSTLRTRHSVPRKKKIKIPAFA